MDYIFLQILKVAVILLLNSMVGVYQQRSIYIYIYIVCMRRANSELLRWSRHFNDVSPFGLLQISVTGLKILGILSHLSEEARRAKRH